MDRHLDMLMKNYQLQSDSSDDYYNHQQGGESSVPTGGFPPIIQCTKKDIDKKKEEDENVRTYAPIGVSIKQILNERKQKINIIIDE
jgi:hypothetical protein